jgi:hypothetical protein
MPAPLTENLSLRTDVFAAMQLNVAAKGPLILQFHISCSV